MADEMRATLLTRPRSIPCKYFYDAHGSELFERICRTEEYYPTRTEEALLRRHAVEIIKHVCPGQILELGSGSSRKTRHLFDACEHHELECSYAPFDVCESMLLDASSSLRQEYSWMRLQPLVGDYNAGLEHLPECGETRMFVILGSTIGNMERDVSRRLLDDVCSQMRSGDCLLVGADRVKDPQVLHAAYNDAEGVTSAFNLNVLSVLNREMDADFRPEHFEHQATFNADLQQIEIRLVSQRCQEVKLQNLDVAFTLEAQETILTEISRKFTYEGINALLEESGLEVDRHYQPSNGYFSLVLSRLP